MSRNETIVGVAVKPLSIIQNDGQEVPITVDQYREARKNGLLRDCMPSREVYFTVDGYDIKVGTVMEVPRRASTPPGGEKKKCGKEGSGEGDGKGNSNRRPYCNRHPSLFCKWDEKRRYLELNRNHPLVKILYIRPDTVGSKTTMMLEEVYLSMVSFCNSLQNGIELLDVDPTAAIEAWKEPFENDGVDVDLSENKTDVLINRALPDFIRENEYLHELIEKVKEKMGETEDTNVQS
jgi:hypothetical protein